MRRLTAIALVCLVLTSGCRTHQPGAAAPVTPAEPEIEGLAPSLKKLEDIAAKRPSDFSYPEVLAVDSWGLGAELPTVVGSRPHETRSAPGALLAARLAEKTAERATEGMQCIARELGLFYLKHQILPSDELQTFVIARCGEPVADVRLNFRIAGPGAGALAGSWASHADAMLATLSPTDTAVGFWAGDIGGSGVMALASAVQGVDLTTLPMDAGAEGFVELQGRFLHATENTEIYATHGKYGVSRCTPAPEVQLPEFRVRCPVDPSDPYVLLEVMSAAPGRLLAYRTMVAMVAPGKRAPGVYVARASTTNSETLPVVASSLRDALNQLRERLKLPPLREETEQGELSTRLLPHYFGAVYGGNPGLGEQIATGLMAGWLIRSGVLRDAGFSTAVVRGPTDPGLLLETMLMTPANRAALLDPNANAIALAVGSNGRAGVTAVMASTYAFFSPADDGAAKQQLHALLDERRAQSGLPPATRLGEQALTPFREARAAYYKGTPLSVAVDRAAEKLQTQLKSSLSYARFEGSDLAGFEFPEECLGSPKVRVGLDVGHYRPQGASQGAFLVFTVCAPG